MSTIDLTLRGQSSHGLRPAAAAADAAAAKQSGPRDIFSDCANLSLRAPLSASGYLRLWNAFGDFVLSQLKLKRGVAIKDVLHIQCMSDKPNDPVTAHGHFEVDASVAFSETFLQQHRIAARPRQHKKNAMDDAREQDLERKLINVKLQEEVVKQIDKKHPDLRVLLQQKRQINDALAELRSSRQGKWTQAPVHTYFGSNNSNWTPGHDVNTAVIALQCGIDRGFVMQGLVDILSHFGSVAGNGGSAELRLPIGKISCSDGLVHFIPKPPHGLDAGFSRPGTHLPAFSAAAAAAPQDKRPVTSDVNKLRSIIGYKGTHVASSSGRPPTATREALLSMSSSIISSTARAALVTSLQGKHEAAAAQRAATAASNKSEDLFGMEQPSRLSTGHRDPAAAHAHQQSSRSVGGGGKPKTPSNADATAAQEGYRQMNARQQVLKQGFDIFEAKAAQALKDNLRIECEMEAQRQRAIQAEKLAARAKELKQKQDRAYLQTQIVDQAQRKKQEWEFNASMSGNGMGKSLPGGDTVTNRDLHSSMRARELSQEYLAQIELKKRLRMMQRDREVDFERQVGARAFKVNLVVNVFVFRVWWRWSLLNLTLWQAFGGRQFARGRQAPKRLFGEGGRKAVEYGGVEHAARAQQDKAQGVGQVEGSSCCYVCCRCCRNKDDGLLQKKSGGKFTSVKNVSTTKQKCVGRTETID